MSRTAPVRKPRPGMERLNAEEEKSVTHGEFWIPEEEREAYKLALHTLNLAGVPYVVAGLYAIYHYTGIYRKTKDLDLFLEPSRVIEAAGVLKEVGFRVRLEQGHWIAKALLDDHQVDLIFGMGNGLSFIDEGWYSFSRPGILAAEQVRVAPAEELLWHRLFVSERHRSDMSDAIHLIMCRGGELDWDRLIERVGSQWRLLLAQIHLFDFVYPGHRHKVPRGVRHLLNQRAENESDDVGDPDACYGTLISRFSFAIDVNEWGMRDLRKEATVKTRSLPIVKEIMSSEVWDESAATP
jgi:hypothetical protein